MYCVAYEGDILCLQEVESQFFNKELNPLLKKYMGMKGVFLKKSGNKSEGLSCFYSSNKFKYVTHFVFFLIMIIVIIVFNIVL